MVQQESVVRDHERVAVHSKLSIRGIRNEIEEIGEQRVRVHVMNRMGIDCSIDLALEKRSPKIRFQVRDAPCTREHIS